MTIAYKGDEYHGFATNPGVETVASVIEGALAQILQEPIKITPAGRTDAGVHAWGQVIGFDLCPLFRNVACLSLHGAQ